jgi:hypothetical protein
MSNSRGDDRDITDVNSQREARNSRDARNSIAASNSTSISRDTNSTVKTPTIHEFLLKWQKVINTA